MTPTTEEKRASTATVDAAIATYTSTVAQLDGSPAAHTAMLAAHGAMLTACRAWYKLRGKRAPKRAAPSPCRRCGGAGHLAQYEHVDGGRCYACQG